MHHFILHMLFAPWADKPAKTIIDYNKRSNIAIVAKHGIFWISIVISPQWNYDVRRTRGICIVTKYPSIVHARVS